LRILESFSIFSTYPFVPEPLCRSSFSMPSSSPFSRPSSSPSSNGRYFRSNNRYFSSMWYNISSRWRYINSWFNPSASSGCNITCKFSCGWRLLACCLIVSNLLTSWTPHYCPNFWRSLWVWIFIMFPPS